MDQQLINETDISSLPPEVIVEIFEFLTFRERLQASRTCKQWHQIAFNARKVRIHIDKRNCLEVTRNMRAYEKYRNASVILLCTDEDFQNAAGNFITTVPLESLKIYSDRECLQTILRDHLPRMSALTSLRIYMVGSGRLAEDVVTINNPTLKAISIDNQYGRERFEINCPCLTDLEMKLNDEQGVHVVSELQHQLQSLELISFGNQHFQTLANAKLDNLKKLCLRFAMDFESSVTLSFSRMMNLEELQLDGGCYEDITIGEELGVLKSLSKLTLSSIVIEVEGFAAALRKMVKLRDLKLMHCRFTPSTKSCHISSEYVEHLYMECETEEVFEVELPDFPRLKKLSFTTGFVTSIDDIFMQICDSYPKLEELRFEAISELYGKFYSSTSFPRIAKVKFLKDLHLVELDLDGVDWTKCSKDVKVENLRLQNCTIRGADVHQLVESIGTGLRRFSLDCCELRVPRLDVVGIKEKYFQNLRDCFPRCMFVLRDSKVIDETCKYQSKYDD